MFSNVSPILFTVLKIYGISSILYDSLSVLLQNVDVDSVTLTYSLAVEGIFFLMKWAQVEIPVWVEAVQDIC